LAKTLEEGGAIFKPEEAPASAPNEKDWSAKSEKYQRNLPPGKLESLAGELGVTADSLRAVGIGWNQGGFRYTFPEKNAAGEVVGIATRRPTDGGKGFIKGGHRGLIIPEGFAVGGDTVYLIEGATDVAAAVAVGLNVVGRPGNRGGVNHLAELLANHAGEVVVVSENDQKEDGSWPGRDGAEATAKALAKRWARSVSWALPPEDIKDVRVWVQSLNINLADTDACRAAGETIRQAISEYIVTIDPDDEAIRTADDGDSEARKSQSTQLVELILATDAELFHTPGHTDSEGFATVTINGHRETMVINSKGFKRWASRLFYEDCGRAPNSQGLTDAINVIAAKAIFEGAEHEVHVRIAGAGDSIWLDLADTEWRAVQITRKGWEVVESCPVRFIRKRGMLPLPYPEQGGSINDLRKFVNVPADDDWVLIIAWLVMAFRPKGPYPILLVNGEQGSAKSSLCRMLRQVIDPNEADLRRPPSDDRDLMIAASNSWVVGFDNLSGLSPKLSDVLCTICTGGGFSTRELYSDDSEKLFNATRPVLANGIDDIASRPDLLDRAVSVTLPAIAEDERRDEDELWRTYRENLPGILGALLDAVSAGLQNFASTTFSPMPRMADFARWVTACEPGLPWEPGRFMATYAENRAGIIGVSIEAASIGPAIMGLMHSRYEWSGSAATLLVELSAERHTDEATRRRRDWPKTPRGLSGMLRRIQPSLRSLGIDVDFGERTRTTRTIRITNNQSGLTPDPCLPAEHAKVGFQPSQPSPPSQTLFGAPEGRSRVTVGDGRGGARDGTGAARDGCVAVGDGIGKRQPSHENPPEVPETPLFGARDGRDGCDGHKPTLTPNEMEI
jgi:hypothetical protein